MSEEQKKELCAMRSHLSDEQLNRVVYIITDLDTTVSELLRKTSVLDVLNNENKSLFTLASVLHNMSKALQDILSAKDLTDENKS